ncbi:MAG: pyridoxamine 5'-phosphate oxidase family protein [Gammaproteobacteria bacterium]|nr:pyridoxamine 5'-phosphate oxidase family protein [Gammaproteobacteria bacterium]MDH4253094.1 pyridoxamine 5'-phosphate oxidase family protein [Gammaproteobacteria bacterium]MDH5308920.1 pyridoxamine 5'-phosphate oxidase family protein [Gammaproteobacteria bacterium]
MSQSLTKTDRTTISRHAERGSYDRKAAWSIIDEALVAHVGLDTGKGVMVIPMTYARIGDEIVLHGAAASRWLSSFGDGRDISVCITLLDGLVLARSAFSHSMNYRSVVAFGRARLVTDPAEKQAAFRALLEHLLPGRWDDCRQPDAKEIAATTVIKLPLDEASVKVRSGPPKDAAKDMDLDYWAGVIPMALVAGEPVADAANRPGLPVPAYAMNYLRGA